MKVLKVEMVDGSLWHIPLDAIIKHAAIYLVDRTTWDLPMATEVVSRRFNTVPDVALDWVKNNVEWSDIALDATKIERPSVSYSIAWKSARIEIVEVEQ